MLANIFRCWLCTLTCLACAETQTTRLPLIGREVHRYDPLLRYSVNIALQVKHGGKTRYSRCSGTLLTAQLVLTAAHCMVGTQAAIVKHKADGINAQPVVAYVHPPSYTQGASTISFISWGAGRVILQTLVKPFSADARVILKDLAVLAVANPFSLPDKLDYRRPVSLDNLTNQRVTIVGYGIGTHTMRGGILRKTGVPVYHDAEFSDLLEFNNFLNRINFGDSGGGVWWYDHDDKLNLVGTHAMAVPLFYFHSFAVDIRQHHDWITRAIQHLQELAPPSTDMEKVQLVNAAEHEASTAKH